MAKRPDFSKPVASPPPVQVTPVTLPQHVRAQAPALDTNGPPLPRGVARPTDYTRQQLSKLGWKEGDPIPGDFATRIAQVQAGIEDERATAKHDLPPDFKPPKSKLVQIEDLPPEKQAELSQYLSEYKTHVAEQEQQEQLNKQLDARYANAGAGVREAAAVAMQAEAAYNASRGMPQQGMLIDDRQVQQQVVPQVKLPEDRQFGGAQGISPVFAKMEQAKQAALLPAPPPPPEAESPTGAELPVHVCPRCEWPTNKAFEAEATDHDILVFKAAMLDPTGQARFRKEYTLLDGSFRIRFRGLSNAEQRLLRQQMRYDVAAGKIWGDGEFYAELTDYRLALSIEQLAMGGEIIDVPPLAEIPYTPPAAGSPPETQLVPLREWVQKEVCPSESLIGMLRVKHQEFESTVKYLETKSTTDPNFSKGIGPQR